MTLVDVSLGETSLALPRVPKEMISVGREGDRTLVRINSSSLGVIQECLRKSQYSLEEGWRSEVESPATLFGRSIHKALEVFYRGSPEERVLPKFSDLELMAYGHKPPENKHNLIYNAVSAFLAEAAPLASLPETDKRSNQNGVWILHEYFKTFINDPYVAYVDSAGPFIERTFSYRFIETDTLIIDIFGTIDFAFRNIHTGEVIVGDHKTASFLNFGDSSYFDRDKPNHQYTMYMLGANRVFGLETESFMVNVIEVKAKPKTAKAKGVSFPRQITKRTREDYLELAEVIEKAVIDYLKGRRTGVWPLGPVGACQSYGGCTYKQICASPPSLRETILKAKFTREESL